MIGIQHDLRRLAKGETEVISVKIKDLVEAASSDPKSGPRLWLPPIQRSLVWDNSRIINFWDSLRRGYPVGTMMVHPAQEQVVSAVSHEAQGADVGDFSLFDGQQRLYALMLGYGLVKMPRRKLWIDLDKVHDTEGEFWSALRISGPGQPFGYSASRPNEKYRLWERIEIEDKWSRREEFWGKQGRHELIGASRAIPLTWFTRPTPENTAELDKLDGDSGSVKRARQIFQHLSGTKIQLISVPAGIVGNDEDYRRFFERVGRGGVALTDKEMAYSIIKQKLPHVRAHMESMAEVARVTDEVDLVLGCYRISRAMNSPSIWSAAHYPAAKDLLDFNPENPDDKMATSFNSFLPKNGKPGELSLVITEITAALSNGNLGFPRMLLPHIHSELWHVLMLLVHLDQRWPAYGRLQPDDIVQFSIWWLLFVHNDQKATRTVFIKVVEDRSIDVAQLAKAVFEADAAWELCPKEDISCMIGSMAPEAAINTWNQRFDGNLPLQHWASDKRVRHRALIWLHRNDLNDWDDTKNFDPGSDKEDDLPIDFDHLVPQSKWDFRWNESRVEGPDRNLFRDARWIIGNGIGNFRILTSRNNRMRGDDPLTDDDVGHRLISEDEEEWKDLSNRGKDQIWSSSAIRQFQHISERRSLKLYAALLDQSGISRLVE